MRQQIDVAQSQKKVETAKFAPDLLVGFFSQTLIGSVNPEGGTVASSSDRFTGFQLGLSLPIWFAPHQGRIKAAEYNKQAAQSSYQYYQTTLNGQLQQAAQQYIKNKNSLSYYRTSALPNAELILKQSQLAFRGGEIGYAEYLLGVRNAITIKEGYLQTLHDYNQSIVYIEFLSGNK
jgi:cobalt-zinc-cadmium resistance protein CzcA